MDSGSCNDREECLCLASSAFRKYKREIKRLDQVPDEELDQLARWNFNSLWLIGIWERSPASQKIKHLTEISARFHLLTHFMIMLLQMSLVENRHFKI